MENIVCILIRLDPQRARARDRHNFATLITHSEESPGKEHHSQKGHCLHVVTVSLGVLCDFDIGPRDFSVGIRISSRVIIRLLKVKMCQAEGRFHGCKLWTLSSTEQLQVGGLALLFA